MLEGVTHNLAKKEVEKNRKGVKKKEGRGRRKRSLGRRCKSGRVERKERMQRDGKGPRNRETRKCIYKLGTREIAQCLKACCSFTGPEFHTQYPGQVAHKCPSLHLQSDLPPWALALRGTGPHTDIYIYT